MDAGNRDVPPATLSNHITLNNNVYRCDPKDRSLSYLAIPSPNEEELCSNT
jgi:hypothetical protein